MIDVDLVLNVHQRTWEGVLAPGSIDALARPQGYSFRRRVLLINNVEEPDRVERAARDRIRAGELDEVHRVERERAAAFDRTGLRVRDFGRVISYSDWAIRRVLPRGERLVRPLGRGRPAR